MLAIDSHTTHIWLLDFTRITDPALLDRYHPLLSDEESARLQRFAFPRLQHNYLVTRAMMRTCLSLYADVAPEDWQFASQENGKPYLLNSPEPLSFNLSHSGERAVLAITRGRSIGVDIEQISRKRDWLGIAQHYFHSDEVEYLCALPEEEQYAQFFRLWTLKEAYLKARGTGIATGLDKASFHLNGGQIRANFAADLGTCAAEWQFFNYRVAEDYCLSLAIDAAIHQPVGIRFFQSRPLDDVSHVPAEDIIIQYAGPTAHGQLA
jgi:4'-phosphopantetheinyl transferase